jgi:hypothetical protein
MISDTNNYKEFQRLGAKDIQNLLINISPVTAKRYLSDIKQHFSITVVTYHHFKLYFKC